MKDNETPDRSPTGHGNKAGFVVSGFAVLVLGTILLLLATGLLATAFWIGTRPLEGELVLTGTGCQALEHHGASVRHLQEGSGCAIHAQFRMNTRARSVRLRVQTAQDPIEVVLATREVVSYAYR